MLIAEVASMEWPAAVAWMVGLVVVGWIITTAIKEGQDL